MSSSKLVLAASIIWGTSLSISLADTRVANAIKPVVLERGPNHRVVRHVTWQTNNVGQISARTNSYTEIATGLHYQENGVWKETKEEIEILPNGAGAVARQGGHKVIFAPNLNTPEVIDLETPDGQRLRSHVLGLGYYDPASGRSEIIAEVKSSEGELVGNNQVIYRDAFDGVAADVRYTYRISGFEQDVILRSSPPAPEKFGLNPKTTRLEVFTEFLNPPPPVKTERAVSGTSLRDEKLTFGQMSLGPGRAFPLADGNKSKSSVPTGKTWINYEGRTILLEEVEYRTVEKHLKQLPGGKKSAQLKAKPANKLLADGRKIPGKLMAARPSSAKPMRLASLSPKEAGFVLDYVAVVEWEETEAVFESGQTYFISAGFWPYTLTIHAGAVVKFADDPISMGWGHTLAGNGVLICPSSGFATLTSMHDDTIGETIDDSTGQPDPDVAAIYLELANGPARIHNLSFKYALAGMVTGGSDTDNQIRDCLFVDCRSGVLGYGAVALTNVTFSDCVNMVDYSWLGDQPGICNLQAERIKDLTGSTVMLMDSGANLASVSLGLHKCCFSSPWQVSEINAFGAAIAIAGGVFVYTPLCVSGDSDGDWLQDSWENQYFKNLNQSADDDYDHDGLSNWRENQLGTNPVSADSDGDGLPDAYEVNTLLTNPNLADTGNTGATDAYKDSDGDGLKNHEEFRLGKNPLVPNVASPNFSPVGNSYLSSQNVTITCPTPGVTIRYTLDGSEPTTASALYSSPLPFDWENNSNPTQLKAKASKTGWTTSETESQTYQVQEFPTIYPPTVTISPSGNLSFLASDSIEFLVEAENAGGIGVSKVQLYRSGYKVAESSTSPLRYSVANVPAGTYTFTAKAIDQSGAVSVSAPVTITIAASGPVVSLVGVQPFFTSSPGTLLANITGVNPEAMATLTLNGNSITPRTGEFQINVTLVEGENTFTLVATDNQSRTAQATTKVYLDSTDPSLAITAPANNASFNTTRVNVSGTFTETSLQQITVNGILAFTSGNTFNALNVPLETGANEIVAVAEDIAGNTTSATINLTGDTTLVDPVQLSASTVGGFTPLAVTFTPTATVPGTLQNVFYDFNGDGTTDQTESNLNPISHTYSTAGEYFPVVTVQTTVGKFSSLGGWNSPTPDRLRINVQAAPVTDSTISITDPVDLKATANGHLFVLSRSTETITEYDASHAVVRSIANIGATPTGLDVDADGNVYVALSGDHQVAKFNPSGGTFQLDGGFGTAGLTGELGSGNGQFNTPHDVAVSPDGTEIFVSDSGNHRIQRFNAATGAFLGAFGSSGSGVGQFNTPKGLTYDGNGYLYIVDSGNNRVVLATSSAVIGTSGSSGNLLGQFQNAVSLGVGPRGIYVADTGNNRAQAFEPIRKGFGFSPMPLDARFSLSSQLGLNQPNAIAPIADFLAEKIYIADTGNNRVIKTTLPETATPDAAWTAMKTSIVSNNDIDGAVTQFSSDSGGHYREAFLSIGLTKLTADFNATGTLTPVFIKGNTAQYYFQLPLTPGGQQVIFTVEFVKENGKWKIWGF